MNIKNNLIIRKCRKKNNNGFIEKKKEKFHDLSFYFILYCVRFVCFFILILLMIMNSILFAICHHIKIKITWNAFLYRFMSGVLYSISVDLGNNLIVGFLCHSLHNLVIHSSYHK